MSHSGEASSDGPPDVLAVGRTDVTTLFVALAGRETEGRDEEYIAWHALDHRPEQHRLAALRHADRLVSTPACRAARAAGDDRYDPVDHVMAYLFAGGDWLAPFGALGAALTAAGRMPMRLPSIELGLYDLAGRAAASRAGAGADVIPWRPARGAYLLVEQGAAPAGDLTGVPGVAGVWWWAGSPAAPSWTADVTGLQITWCYLDDDPVETAARLRGPLEERWAAGGAAPLLAAPFHTITPYEWGRWLP